ncbi:uncharacterized protein N7518_001122 [Penicillium psychrosexuale]|uniref:uncharacterized protein n=1 Tax=Penicillium psychrosexuale TaxID=1002107 RepID=UPI002545A952|nr:uncharacterized protein N7518_001122 [Penicillium psychrosexuale]KAJ5799054.1 hypothetical protein N7518_001122 [Penicillium psychrosexuale]
MAKRCSVCDQWIKTGGGAHTCPGAPPKPPSNPKSKMDDELLAVSNGLESKGTLLDCAGLV